MTSHLGTGSDTPSARTDARATRAWIVSIVVTSVVALALLLAWTTSGPRADERGSRTIPDIELEDDVTSTPVTGGEFRPVMRRVARPGESGDEPATAPNRGGGTRGGPANSGGSSGSSGGGSRGGGGGGGGSGGGSGGGGGNTGSTGGGGGGGGTNPTPTQPAPEPEVPVVNLPPQVVGPVTTPGVAVGITDQDPLGVSVFVGETQVADIDLG